ncbi:SDR family oxidoreductase [Roseospira navarrensis]|uniref:SDR family NAD(P)-dependent oxidoreductase n=1 Tax=Roseospira navarrensis TaxID=140058 RepID=A0A7X1ZFD6_9PROT|nr:SDR family oxidoreductase [Roseospira navarrensis]MQX36571.1 SDR family NAD(P)-dependent oxidoreductase [Roseospira navarrensis]
MSSPPAPALLCLGLGYTAHRLARALRAEGWHVAGTARTEAGAAALEDDGFEGLVFDGERPLPPSTLRRFSHVLVSIPPDDRGDPVLRAMGDDLAAADGLGWIGYLSTTGVYGDADGAWVDEDSPTRPTQARSIRRLEAEQHWFNLWRDQGRPVEVFRLAGIYGPGRSALDSVRAGRAHRVVKPGHVVCRIHVDDIAEVLRAAMARPYPGAIYNCADDEPAPPQDVIAEACALLGVEPPPEVPLEDADLSPMARSFYADTRRVRNDRLKTRLGVRLRYPGYREGLRAILDAAHAGPGP